MLVVFFPLLLFTYSCNEQKSNNEDAPVSSPESLEMSQDTLTTSTCDCSDETLIYLNCDTTFLSNNSMLYWSYECDSVFYFFENDGVLNSLKSGSHYGLISEIGMTFIKEYDHYLYFIEEHISGCCAPPDIVLLDTNDASEIYRVYADLYVFADVEKNYILHFKNDNFKELVFYDLAKNKKQQFSLKSLEVRRAANEMKPLHIKDLFTISNSIPSYIDIELNTGIDISEKIKIKVR